MPNRTDWTAGAEGLRFYAGVIIAWGGLVTFVIPGLIALYVGVPLLITGEAPPGITVTVDPALGSQGPRLFAVIPVISGVFLFALARGLWLLGNLMADRERVTTFLGIQRSDLGMYLQKARAEFERRSRRRWLGRKSSPPAAEWSGEATTVAELAEQIRANDRQQREREARLLLIGAGLGLLTNVLAVPLLRLLKLNG